MDPKKSASFSDWKKIKSGTPPSPGGKKSPSNSGGTTGSSGYSVVKKTGTKIQTTSTQSHVTGNQHPVQTGPGQSPRTAGVRRISFPERKLFHPEKRKAQEDEYSNQAVTIKEPADPPPPPSSNLVAVLLPIGGITLGLLISVIATLFTGPGGVPIFLFVSVPMMLASGLAGIIKYRSDDKTRKAKIYDRETRYRQHLAEKQAEILRLSNLQRMILNDAHPDLEVCQTRARSADSRLWERLPGEDDFLAIRLGLGEMPVGFKIEVPPESSKVQKEDELIKTGRELGEKSKKVDRIAIPLPILQRKTVGLVGPHVRIMQMARAMLVQVTACHSPANLKVVLVVPSSELEEWKWARWLPHLWSAGKQKCLLFSGRENLASGLKEIEKILLEPKREDMGGIPAHLFIVSDPEVMVGKYANQYKSLFGLISNAEKPVGAAVLFLSESKNSIPACNARIDLSNPQAVLESFESNLRQAFLPDLVNSKDAEDFARMLARIRYRDSVQAQGKIASVPFLSLFGVKDVSKIPIRENWARNNPDESLSVPVGILEEDGSLFSIDIQDGKDGPNGLVGGMTGSGKGEFLTTFILSLAIKFDPHLVNVAIVDFKNGDLLNSLRGLPHLVSEITDREMEDIPQVISGLRSELKRRHDAFTQMFNQYKYHPKDLREYNLFARQHQLPAIPYLILIVDEFTVLKEARENDLSEFIRIALQGRHAGMRMILAAQKPDKSTITAEINNQLQLRISFKLLDKETSTLILGYDDAASLERAGNGVAVVNSVAKMKGPDIFQAGYPGAIYLPDQPSDTEQVTINVVTARGERKPLFSSYQLTNGAPKQVNAIVEHLSDLFRPALPSPGPWMTPLPTKVFLSSLIDHAWGWNGNQWVDGAPACKPIVGLASDPIRRVQEPIRVDLEKLGHLVVYSVDETVNLELIKTLISGMAMENPPSKVNFYVMDFIGHELVQLCRRETIPNIGTQSIYGGLKVFSPPHIGALIFPEGNSAHEDVLTREWIKRLFDWLNTQRSRRLGLLSKGYSNLSDYRNQNPAAGPEPEIVVFLRGFRTFQERFFNNPTKLHDLHLDELFDNGGKCGIHFVITTNDIGSFPSSLRSKNILSILYKQQNTHYYSLLNLSGKTDKTYNLAVDGRGLVFSAKSSPIQFQTAHAGDITTRDDNLDLEESRQIAYLRSEFEKMSHTSLVNAPFAIPQIPQLLDLSDILQHTDQWNNTPGELCFPVGIDLRSSSLDIINFRLGLSHPTHCFIAQTDFHGSSAVLKNILIALGELYPPEQIGFYLFDDEEGGLKDLISLKHHIKQYYQVGQILTKALVDELISLGDQAKGASSMAPLFIFNGVGAVWKNWLNGASIESGADWSKFSNWLRADNPGFTIVAAGQVDDFRQTELGIRIKKDKTGFLLGTSDPAFLTTFVTPGYGTFDRPMDPDEGFLIQDAKIKTLVKFVNIYQSSDALAPWLELIQSKTDHNTF
jgi:S-DNA-T family DNA segregation ATPase FtsK/SpoIIIE